MKFHFVFTSRHAEVGKALENFWGNNTPESCDVLVVLGGDGSFLHALHQYRILGKPFFGLCLGHKGAFMNAFFTVEDVKKQVLSSQQYVCCPLRIEPAGDLHEPKFYAFNDFIITRARYRAIRWRSFLNDHVFHPLCMGDGVVVATALGSTGYNASVGGAVLPITLSSMIMTPINLCSPLYEKSYVLEPHDTLRIEPVQCDECPFYVGWDVFESKEWVNWPGFVIRKDQDHCVNILFEEKVR